jgi:hypothetical protein
MRPDAYRLDWELARRGYARYAAYPAATIAGVFVNTVFGFMRAYILLALFEQRDTLPVPTRAPRRASLRDLTVEEPEIDDVVRRIYLETRP